MQPVLSVRDLQVSFPGPSGQVRAVDGVSFDVNEGETLGVVGESGSGKSLTSLSVLGLVPRPGEITAGRIFFEGQDLSSLPARELRRIRGRRIAIIFQDPMTSLNPFLPVSDQIAEVAREHLKLSRAAAREHAISMLEMVGIPEARTRADSYPHQFSGGMRQRVMIAMALACKPKLLIADEPTTALDVTIQAQILELLRDAKRQSQTAVVLITHDLGLVAENADAVTVMYAGRVMEYARVDELFRNPQNPYTRALLRCIPDPAERTRGELYQIAGQPPDVSQLRAEQCPFVERCPEAIAQCSVEAPPFHAVGENHWSRCWVR